MKPAIIIVKFLFVGALFLVSTHGLHLSDSHDLDTFFELYYGWLNNLFDRSLELTGYMVHSEWLPSNHSSSGAKLFDFISNGES